MKSTIDGPQQQKALVKSPNQFPVVGIGASAGGLDAFKKLLKAIPENSGMAYVLVQHLDPKHESLLPELLQKVTKIPVLEIADDIKVEPNHIYIIPSNKMLIANDGVLRLSPRPGKEINIRYLPIDLFFESLAEVHQSHAIGVVLSGTATDGTRGLKAIKDNGGITFAQDEISAQYDSMPNSAVQAGVVDFILPPEDIPQKLLELTAIIDGTLAKEDGPQQEEADVFKQILSLLRIRKGTDFTYYKQTTIRRRILRRIALNKSGLPSVYLKYLRENKAEQDVLYQDLLIPVTSFFRDSKVFEILCQLLFPAILKSKAASEPLRVWVAGCSTGEEVYSIAICLREFLGDSSEKVQIFATDISEPAIAKARTGKYKKSETDGVSPQRLQEFFTKTDGMYQVNKSLRDLCVFAVHNFLKDPPFSKMDLITCRNVLIYMEPYLQKKALTTFHYGLNPHGFLLLGKSETISSAADFFAANPFKGASHEKIFTRKNITGRFLPSPARSGGKSFDTMPTNTGENLRPDFQKTADDIMLSKYTPAGVVVNEAMDIVHFRGKTAPYLEQLPGKPSHNLLKMAREGLAFELRNLLHKVKKEKTTVVKENIPLTVNGNLRYIALEALLLPNTIEPHFLVLFHEKSFGPILQEEPGNAGKKSRSKTSDEKDLRIAQLEKELAQTREDMRSITEDQEVANEELQSANEELLSSSEELQSLNEELETGKEELQSTNEELLIINQEMTDLNEQVNALLHYSEAVVATIREPLLVLDKDLRVKTANSNFYKTFLVNQLETEGKLVYELGNHQWDIPELRTLLEKILPENTRFRDFEVNANFSNLGQRVMILNGCEIVNKNTTEKLILLAIEDATERRQLLQKEKELNEIFHNMIIQAPVIMIVFKGRDHVVEIANGPALELFGKSREQMIKIPIFDGLPEVEAQRYKTMLDHVYKTGERSVVSERETNLWRNGRMETLYLNFVYDPFRDTNGTVTGVVGVGNDVTEQVLARKKVEESESHFHRLADLMPAKISNADTAGNVLYFNKQWLDFTGLDFEELKNLGYHTIMHPDELEEFQQRFQHASQTSSDVEMEMRFRNKQGDYIWHLNIASPVKDDSGNIQMWIGATTEIQKMKAEEQRRSDFIKMVSHELKTPVTSIKGYVQMLLMILKEEKVELFPVQIKNSLVRIDHQVSRLTRLITEMLDLSRIETGQLELHTEVFSLNDLVKEAIEDISLTNPKHIIVIHPEYVCDIYGDRGRIEQVIINLVTNAIKYSGNSDQIEVRIRQAENNRVAVSVKDNGIGIDKTEHQKIFERFYRVGGKVEETYGGFGIGLFIANAIIERHHGAISIESEKGKGAVFTFTLPVATEINLP